MTIRRDHDTVVLEGQCDVEDAEVLVQHLQAGATLIDWAGCTHLHTACLQVLLAARLPVHGTPPSASLARWVAPLLQAAGLHPGSMITGQDAAVSSPVPAI
jgi:hypothetical protein